MSTAWVAGNVRAKAMLDRRIGPARARELAATGSLAQAQQILADSPYRHGVQVGQTLAEAEHALAATVLWHLRVLAGWQPRAGARALRLLAGWFEIANISGHARALSGAAVEPSFQLGALGTAWSRLRTTSSLAELMHVLTQSLWGDPGGDSPSDIALGVELAWAFRVATGVPEASEWACGGAAGP
jgi:vacuolar-type H+-ATPase subunit C/Vma6